MADFLNFGRCIGLAVKTIDHKAGDRGSNPERKMFFIVEGLFSFLLFPMFLIAFAKCSFACLII